MFCRSVSVYGRIAKKKLIDEHTATDPDSPYGQSKVLGKQIVLSSRIREGLPVWVASIATVWGRGTTGWLGRFRSIAFGQFRLIGKGINYHHLVDVSDVVEGLLPCGARRGIEGRTYILAGSESVQLRRIGEEVGLTSFPGNFPSTPLPLWGVQQVSGLPNREPTVLCRSHWLVPGRQNVRYRSRT